MNEGGEVREWKGTTGRIAYPFCKQFAASRCAMPLLTNDYIVMQMFLNGLVIFHSEVPWYLKIKVGAYDAVCHTANLMASTLFPEVCHFRFNKRVYAYDCIIF